MPPGAEVNPRIQADFITASRVPLALRAANGLLLLINGSVADWLREPGEDQIVTTIMRLIAALLKAISLTRRGRK